MFSAPFPAIGGGAEITGSEPLTRHSALQILVSELVTAAKLPCNLDGLQTLVV